MLTLVTTFFGYILIGTVAISKYESGSSVSPTTLSRGGWWSLKHTNKNVDIKFSAPRKIGKPNNFKTIGAIKLKVLRYICYWNWQILNNVIIIKTKVPLDQA
jgi:hypothetical protein